MPIKTVKGDLIKMAKGGDFDIIGHQVNCQGVMGSGIAAQIRQEFPEVYSKYYEKCYGVDSSEDLLGGVQAVDIGGSVTVINMFCQDNFNRWKRVTNYEAIASCLEWLKANVESGSKIGFPMFGAGLGGGNWKIIYTMIEEYLAEDFDITIVEWVGGE